MIAAPIENVIENQRQEIRALDQLELEARAALDRAVEHLRDVQRQRDRARGYLDELLTFEVAE